MNGVERFKLERLDGSCEMKVILNIVLNMCGFFVLGYGW